MKILLLVGPSGSGKDTLLRRARDHFRHRPEVVFIRRYITRPPDANEDNFFLDRTAFSVLQKSGFFLAHWQAHNNHYGIARHVFTGGQAPSLLLVSVSRQAVGDFEHYFPQTTTILVTAETEVLRERLLRRGREDHEAIARRLYRARQPVMARDFVSFDNSGSLAESAAAFVRLIEGYRRKLTERVGMNTLVS